VVLGKRDFLGIRIEKGIDVANCCFAETRRFNQKALGTVVFAFALCFGSLLDPANAQHWQYNDVDMNQTSNDAVTLGKILRELEGRYSLDVIRVPSKVEPLSLAEEKKLDELKEANIFDQSELANLETLTALDEQSKEFLAKLNEWTFEALSRRKNSLRKKTIRRVESNVKIVDTLKRVLIDQGSARLALRTSLISVVDEIKDENLAASIEPNIKGCEIDCETARAIVDALFKKAGLTLYNPQAQDRSEIGLDQTSNAEVGVSGLGGTRE